MTTRIAILGDFDPVHYTLHALNDSTRAVQKFLHTEIQFDWIPTDLFNPQIVFEKANYSPLWIAPGSPYKNMRSAKDIEPFIVDRKIPNFTLGLRGYFRFYMERKRNIS